MASALLRARRRRAPVEEDPVAEQQLLHVGVDLGEAVEHGPDLVEHAVVEVVEHAADPGVAGMEPVARHLFVDVVDQLPQVEGEQERRERPQVERGGAGAEQVIADPRQLGDDHADVLAARGQLDVQQLLDRVVPGHLVHRRADVVLAVDDRHVLVEVEVLAQLLEAGVQIADVGRGLDDPLAVELEDQPQGRVGGGMLRPEVERPGGLLRLGLAARVRRAIRSTSRHPVSMVSRAGRLKTRPATAAESYAARRALGADSLSGADRR